MHHRFMLSKSSAWTTISRDPEDRQLNGLLTLENTWVNPIAIPMKMANTSELVSAFECLETSVNWSEQQVDVPQINAELEWFFTVFDVFFQGGSLQSILLIYAYQKVLMIQLTAVVSNLIVPTTRQRWIASKQWAILLVWVENVEKWVALPACIPHLSIWLLSSAFSWCWPKLLWEKKVVNPDTINIGYG